MVRKSLHVAQQGVRDAGVLEQVHDLIRSVPGQGLLDYRGKVRGVLNTQGIAYEAFVLSHFSTAEDPLAKSSPLTFVLNAQENLLRVTASEGTVRGDGSVGGTCALRRGPPVHGIVQREAHPL